MAINKIPKNYYSDTNIRRDKINEIIDEVNDIASIPSPAAADAGKVIKVSGEGSYELAQDAGAKELTVTLSSNFTADKTYTEILTALNSGDIVKVIDWTGRNYIYSGMTSGRICFAYLNGNPTTQVTDVYTAAVDDTNTWELFLDDITDLPDYSSADAGKVLTVDNAGTLGFANVPNKIHYVTISIAGTAVFLPSGITNSIIISWLESGDVVILKDINRKVYVIQGWGIPNIDAAKYTFDCLEFTDTAITVSRINIGITNIVYYTHTYTLS